MLTSPFRYVNSSAYWLLGVNNISAMAKVIKGVYPYSSYDSPIGKVNQIGTEFLHIGFKYYAMNALREYVFTSKDESELSLGHRFIKYAVNNSLYYGKPGVGTLCLLYAGYNCLMESKEGLKLLKRSIHKKNSDAYVISPEKFQQAIYQFGNCLASLPILTSFVYRGFGYTLPLATIGVAYTPKHRGLIKTAFFVAGVTDYLINSNFFSKTNF